MLFHLFERGGVGQGDDEHGVLCFAGAGCLKTRLQAYAFLFHFGGQGGKFFSGIQQGI